MNAVDQTDSNILMQKDNHFSLIISPDNLNEQYVELDKSMGILEFIDASPLSFDDQPSDDQSSSDSGPLPPESGINPNQHSQQAVSSQSRKKTSSNQSTRVEHGLYMDKSTDLVEQYSNHTIKRVQVKKRIQKENKSRLSVLTDRKPLNECHSILEVKGEEDEQNKGNPSSKIINEDPMSQNVLTPERAHLNNIAPNRDEEESGNVNNLRATARPSIPIPNLIQLYTPEVKIYLTKNLAFFVFMILFSAFFILGIHNTFLFEGLFILIVSYLSFLASIDIFWTRTLLEELWLQSDDVFVPLDAVCKIFALIILDLRLNRILSHSVFGCIFFLLLVCFYHFSSETPIKMKVYRNLPRYYYIIQTLLLTLKIDDFIHWNWEIVFIPSWIYFSINCLDFFKNAFSLLKLFFSIIIKRNRAQRSENIMRIIGTLWCILNHAWNLLAILGILGFIRCRSPMKDFRLLIDVAYLSTSLSIILTIYTIFARKHLTCFIATFQLIESHLVRYEEQNERKPKTEIVLQVERRESFFMMLSPSYFLPLKKSFISRSKKNVKKMKHHNTQGNQYEYKRARKRSSTVISEKNDSLNNSPLPRIKGKDFELALSLDNIEKIKEFETSQSIRKSNNDDNVCYICYSNIPDSILMGCGHGGICYECAVSLVKRKNECMECRGQVQSIYKVDRDFKFNKIIKTIEVSKIVYLTD